MGHGKILDMVFQLMDLLWILMEMIGGLKYCIFIY